MKDQYRVGKRVGQPLWQIKQAPGWRIAHEVWTLEEAGAWLIARGVDLAEVSVLTPAPWQTLAEHLKANGKAISQ